MGQTSGEDKFNIQNQYDSILRGMASIYESMFLIDREERCIIQLDANQNTKKYFSEKDNYSEKFKNYLRNVVADNSLYAALMFCDLHTLKARLRYKNVIDKELVGKDIGWFRAQFVVINRNEAGIPTQFVFTTHIIDAEKSASDQQQKIIQSLADIYFTLHVFDLEKDTVEEVSTQELVHRIHSENKTSGCQRTIHAAIEQTTAEEFIDHMKEFTDLSTLDERMNGRKMISTELLGYGGWAKAFFIEVESNESGKLKKVLYATQIIDEEKRKEERLVKRAMTDELTGLYNRRAYEEDLLDASEKISRGGCISFAAMDVNGLKRVNDNQGHEAGDELIAGAAKCIEASLCSYGKIYRIGGDEFAAILYVEKQILPEIKERLNKIVSEWKGDRVDSLSLSSGFVCSSDYSDTSVSDIVKAADREMYEDKNNFYRTSGLDRRAQKDAFEVLIKSYTKVLKVNLTTDAFSIIRVEKDESSYDMEYEGSSISEWLYNFAVSGDVHEDDREQYLESTSLSYLRDYFTKEKKIYTLSYRRRIGNEFKKVIMEMIPDNDFTLDNMSVFLYVKGI